MNAVREDIVDVIEIPVWFIKLSGFLLSALGLLFISWGVWMSVAVIEIQANLDQTARLETKLELLRAQVERDHLNYVKLAALLDKG